LLQRFQKQPTAPALYYVFDVLWYNGNDLTAKPISGFSEKGLKDAVDRMQPLLSDKCPFVNPPNIKEKIQWVQPKLICEAQYAELTADGQLRQTTFLGWRDDKKAEEVVLE
jgi:bifunctional non-homologous end joining protein LigD